MVFGNIVRQLLFTVVYPVVKPIIKSYSDKFVHQMRRGIQSGDIKNQFKRMFEEVSNSTGLTYPKMTEIQARKILGVESVTNLYSRQILNRYYDLVQKNNPKTGGSLYIQSKLFSAKQNLLQKYPNAADIEKQYIKQFGLDAENENKKDDDQKK